MHTPALSEFVPINRQAKATAVNEAANEAEATEYETSLYEVTDDEATIGIFTDDEDASAAAADDEDAFDDDGDDAVVEAVTAWPAEIARPTAEVAERIYKTAWAYGAEDLATNWATLVELPEHRLPELQAEVAAAKAQGLYKSHEELVKHVKAVAAPIREKRDAKQRADEAAAMAMAKADSGVAGIAAEPPVAAAAKRPVRVTKASVKRTGAKPRAPPAAAAGCKTRAPAVRSRSNAAAGRSVSATTRPSISAVAGPPVAAAAKRPVGAKKPKAGAPAISAAGPSVSPAGYHAWGALSAPAPPAQAAEASDEPVSGKALVEILLDAVYTADGEGGIIATLPSGRQAQVSWRPWEA